jgi:hypothetical protein
MLVTGEIYVDSECRTLATVLSDECELPEYVAVQASSPQLCSGLYEANAYRLSTKHDTGVRYNSNACYESAYDPERYSMYELEPLPLGDLPILALEAVQSSDSDARETLLVRGDDGAFSSLSLSIKGHSCQLVEMGESLRCIAGSPITSGSGFFSDAGCSADVATSWMSHPDCDSAAYALFYASDPTDSCKTSIIVREVTGELDPAAPLYGGSPESCYETVQSDRGAYYLLGSEAEPDDLPEVTRRLVGEGRLQRIEYRFSDAPDSPPAYSPGAYDTRLGSECNFSHFSDGKVRCVPSDATHLTASPFFADAGCTTKLASIQDCLATPPPRIGYLPSTAQCGIYSAAIDELYEFGDVHSGATYQQTNAGCEAVERLDSVTYFVLSLVDPDAVLGGIDSQLR